MVPTEQKDLNALYVNEMSIINTKPPKEENKVNPEQRQEDYYKVRHCPAAFRRTC
jgi:chitin synthase